MHQYNLLTRRCPNCRVDLRNAFIITRSNLSVKLHSLQKRQPGRRLMHFSVEMGSRTVLRLPPSAQRISASDPQINVAVIFLSWASSFVFSMRLWGNSSSKRRTFQFSQLLPRYPWSTGLCSVGSEISERNVSRHLLTVKPNISLFLNNAS
jgi:hypothetical protein